MKKLSCYLKVIVLCVISTISITALLLGAIWGINEGGDLFFEYIIRPLFHTREHSDVECLIKLIHGSGLVGAIIGVVLIFDGICCEKKGAPGKRVVLKKKAKIKR